MDVAKETIFHSANVTYSKRRNPAIRVNLRQQEVFILLMVQIFHLAIPTCLHFNIPSSQESEVETNFLTSTPVLQLKLVCTSLKSKASG